jgi:hypothetical protein
MQAQGIFRGNGSDDQHRPAGRWWPVDDACFGVDMAFSNSRGRVHGPEQPPLGTTDNAALYLSDGRETLQVVRRGRPGHQHCY